VRHNSNVFQYRVAEIGSADFTAWLRLRTDVYLETRLITPDELNPAGLFVDAYEDHSVHVLASDAHGTDVACTRLIDGSDGAPLQVADLFGITPLSHPSEASGTAVVAPYRKSWVSLGLYRALFEIAVDRKHEHRYAILEPRYLASLRALGYPYQVVGEPMNVFGFPNIAGVYPVADLLASMEQADGPQASVTFRYFSRTFDWTLTREDLLEPAP
jgi:N-acyl-L-homoserine lactone synthetase